MADSLMNTEHHFRWAARLSTLTVLTVLLASTAAAEWHEKVLYSFQGGTDGAIPAGGVVFDKLGNLYGATQQGGGTNCSPMAACGTAYQLSPPAKQGDPWTETLLHVFKGKQYNDGEFPSGGVIATLLEISMARLPTAVPATVFSWASRADAARCSSCRLRRRRMGSGLTPSCTAFKAARMVTCHSAIWCSTLQAISTERLTLAVAKVRAAIRTISIAEQCSS